MDTTPARLVTATIVMVAAVAANSPAIQRDPNVCRAERDAVHDIFTGSGSLGRRSLERGIDRSYAMFRFHRIEDARLVVDNVEKRFAQSPDVIAADDRAAFQTAVKSFRSCVSTATPSAMATLAVRTNYVGESGGRVTERPTGEGVYIRVDGVPVGRTSAASTLTAQVPSGPVTVTAIVPPTSLGEGFVALRPDGAGSITITLDQDKEVTDETSLMLVEAPDGVLRADVKSLTLKFVENTRSIALRRIQAIELLNDTDDVTRSLEQLFTISGPAIVAVNVEAALDALHSDTSGRIRLRVQASDPAGFIHSNVVEFRLQK